MTSTPQTIPGPPLLAGRTAVVTGSTSGIGAAIAGALAAAGAHVVVSGRDRRRGDEVTAAIRSGGGRADFVAADLAGPYEALRDFAGEATAALGGHVDVLVNNAGIYPAPSTEALADTDLDAMLAINVRAPHVLVAALAPAMGHSGAGVIVNVGSWMARTGTPFAGMYTATKAALEQLTRAWAAEFGPAGVRVVTLSPGATLTPGNEASLAALEAMTARTPAGRVVRPDDVASAAVWLCSDAASMVQGSILSVDGGIAATWSM